MSHVTGILSCRPTSQVRCAFILLVSVRGILDQLLQALVIDVVAVPLRDLVSGEIASELHVEEE